METKILNTWRSEPNKLDYFFERGEPVYKNGDYTIYHQFTDSYLYTYENIAINHLAGLNKAHLDRLAADSSPEKNSPEYFLFKRAKETKQKGINLLK